jgi:hypothetical protein
MTGIAYNAFVNSRVTAAVAGRQPFNGTAERALGLWLVDLRMAWILNSQRLQHR